MLSKTRATVTGELCLLLHKMKQGNFYCGLHLSLNIAVDLIHCNAFVFSVMPSISGLLNISKLIVRIR